VVVQKHATTASKFVKDLSLWKEAQTAILHTRFPTWGDPKYNENNHPIPVGHIVGVHNGSLSNDWELWREMGLNDYRMAEVDSEAAFAALAWGTEKADDNKQRLPGCFTTADVLEQIEGTAALAWVDRTDPKQTLHLARLNSSPLVVCQSVNGSVIFASEHKAIEAAADRCGLKLDKSFTWTVDEGTYLTVREGVICDVEPFEPAKRWTGIPQSSKTLLANVGTSTSSKAKLALPQRTVDIDTGETDTYDEADLCSSALGDGLMFSYNEADFDFEYRERLAAIDDYYGDLTDADEETRDMVATDLKFSRGDVKPGQWVETKVAGRTVYGQLYQLPLSYPEGDYIIIARVPVFDEQGTPTLTRDGNLDLVFVRRKWDEFFVVPAKRFTPARQEVELDAAY
jgi:hypothetical protein